MELLFVIVLGAGIGGLFRYVLPERRTYGALLLPAVGSAAASIVWVALLWAGFTFDGGWIWVASLGAAGVAAIVTALLLPRRRVTQDATLLTQLSGGKA